MATFLSLPPELLLEIFAIFCYTSPDDQWRMYERLASRIRRLSRLSVVHSTWTPVARSLMVAEVQLCRSSKPQYDEQLALLTQVLAQPPWNATKPQYLILAASTENGIRSPALFKDPTEIGPFAHLVWIRCRHAGIDLYVLSFIKSKFTDLGFCRSLCIRY
jgi:hypothetical protein